jgi:hypothetical protein
VRLRFGFLATCGALAVALLAVFAAPAHAGGSAWFPEKTSYTPGEVAVARGDFGAGCCDRGWVDDGPYRVWLVPFGENSLTGLLLPATAVLVGDLHVEQQQYEWNGAPMHKWVASVEFVVPDVAPGPYQLVHCTDPCGRGLGDLMYAFFWVGPVPDFPAPSDEAAAAPSEPPATTVPGRRIVSSAGVASAEGSTSPVPFAIGGVMAVVAFAGIALVVQRRRAR